MSQNKAQTATNPSKLLLEEPITPEAIASHGLTEEEYALLNTILSRVPNIVELGVASAMWSEHCSYKNSRPLLKKFPTQRKKLLTKKNNETYGEVLVKAGEENAGVIDIGGGEAICFKIESHNHPSAVEPFEGAATGVGGILRDIFTMGARPVLATNSLRFGPLEEPNNKRLMRGVVAGIANYGNCFGVPNIAGDIAFDDCFSGNPLVNALALGTLKHTEIKRGAASGVGNPVYYVGAATGRDGLGGAAFSSKELSDASAEDRPAVQKGDPFLEKLLMEACLEMMAVEGLVVGIQDMGAAGLTCSICETAARGGTGIAVELNHVPQREANMNAYEMLLSESQERMLVIVQKGREAELEAIFNKWDLHSANVGTVTGTGRMVVTHGGIPVVDVPAAQMADDAPVYHRTATAPTYLAQAAQWSADSFPQPAAQALTAALPTLLAQPTIAHKQWVWNQYDYRVGASTAVIPGSSAGVLRLRNNAEGSAQGSSNESFIAITNDGNHRHCRQAPKAGAIGTVAEALRNLACSGARGLGLTNNLNFGNPRKPDAFYMLQQCCEGLVEACEFFDLPVVGGNVSLNNETRAKDGSVAAIAPTPVISVAGLIENAAHITPSSIQTPGMPLILLGENTNELGASMYLEAVIGEQNGSAPAVNLAREAALQTVLLSAIEAGHIHAAQDCSDGGLLVTLAEMLFGPGAETFGANIELSNTHSLRLDALLYGEAHGRALVAVQGQQAAEAVAALAAAENLPATVLGTTTQADTLNVTVHSTGAEAINLQWNTTHLRETYENALPKLLDA